MEVMSPAALAEVEAAAPVAAAEAEVDLAVEKTGVAVGAVERPAAPA